MKVSIAWLQKYFDEPLPSAEVIDDAFTFHSFEIEEREGDWIDLNVLPNRAADCLSHRGIARELSAILSMRVVRDPLQAPPRAPSAREAAGDLQSASLRNEELAWNSTNALTVTIEDTKKCKRYIGALVRGVRVGPSPDWLKKALEAVGQRSINNIVDATNYVMLDIGQPLHAFDARKLSQENGAYKITVRAARAGEHITTLSGKELSLPEGVLLITDGNSSAPLGIAGVKGGNKAEVDEATTDIVIESASFDGATVRRSAQQVKLFTDASLRFQNNPSSRLPEYGARAVLALITEIAGGEVCGVVDIYEAQAEPAPVTVSLEKINGLLGSNFTVERVEDVFTRLSLPYKVVKGGWEIIPPFERTDINIPEDIIEEIGRIIGYDTIVSTSLPEPSKPADQAHFRGIEKVKDFLVARGFTEISTQTFAKKGDIILANPLDKTKPALRGTLAENMSSALAQAKQYAPRSLGSVATPKLFEIGTIFSKHGEQLVVETSEPVEDLPKIVDDATYVPKRCELSAYKPFSVYPFMLRDIAVWTPEGTESVEVEALICEYAGALLVRTDQFDSFTKDGRVSYAFRLVFESLERTLTDKEVNGYMEKITNALNAQKDYEVR